MATFTIASVIFIAMGGALAWVIKQKADGKSSCGCDGTCKGGCPGCKDAAKTPLNK